MTRLRVPLLGGLLLFAAFSDAQPQQQPSILDLADRGKPRARPATARLIGSNVDGRPAVAAGEDAWSEVLSNIGTAKGVERPAGFAFAGADVSNFSNLEAVGCDQLALTGCTVDQLAVGPALGFLARPFRLPVGLGLRGGYSNVSLTQVFASPPFPLTSVTDLDVWSATAFADAWLDLDRSTRLVGTAGYVWSLNRAKITSTFADRTEVEHRKDDGGRYTVGASLERDLSSRSWLRLEYRFIDGDTGDADRQHQVGLLFGLGLFGGRAAGAMTSVGATGPGAATSAWSPRPRTPLRPVPPVVDPSVPSLIGRNVSDAGQILDALDVDMRVTHRRSGRPADEVIGQGPLIPSPTSGSGGGGVDRGGQEIKPIVDVVVARGVATPELAGLRLDEALRRVADVGLTAGGIGYVASEAPLLTVVGQLPPAGGSVSLGTPVDLDVSGVIVPDIADGGDVPPEDDLEGIRRALTASGLVLGSVDRVPSRLSLGTVLGQTPGGGAVVAPNTPVDIRVAGGVGVPDVGGGSLDRAGERLRDAGLTLGQVVREASDRDPGTVLGQTPSAGVPVPLETPVDLVVATDSAGGPRRPLPGDTVIVPNVIGRDATQVGPMLADAGLTVGEVTLQQGSGTPGTVISQTPVADSRVVIPRAVDLVVATDSAGGPGPTPVDSVTVPDVLGQTEADARTRITEVGLTLGSVVFREGPETPGTVTSQTPAANSRVVLPRAVELVVAIDSTGRPPPPPPPPPAADSVTVPDVVGQAEASARARVTDVGLTLGSVTFREGPQTPGTVASQTPAANSRVVLPRTMDLVVAIDSAGGPTPPRADSVTVPDLIGLNPVEARAELGDSLTTGDITERLAFRRRGFVIDQSPQPGVRVPRGTPVAMTLPWRWLFWLLWGGGGAIAAWAIGWGWGPGPFGRKKRPKPDFVGHPDPSPSIETDPPNPLDGIEIRVHPVSDPGQQSVEGPEPLVTDENRVTSGDVDE